MRRNVLVSQLKDGSLRMLVSDFGLARRLEQDQSSFAPTANNLAGSLGWRAPECIRGQVRLNEGFDRASSWSSSSNGSSSSLLDLLDTDDKDGNGNPVTASRNRNHARLTKAVDLFALGCLYFWVLMSGEHPFGETYNRESNIVKGEAVNMSQLDILGEEGWEAKELIGRLLEMDPEDRPDTSECLQHPFFWTSAKRLAFLCDASDRRVVPLTFAPGFEIMETDPPEQTLVMLETGAVTVVGKDWFSRADKVFTSNLGKYRKYKGNSVRDLLRAMRNKVSGRTDLGFQWRHQCRGLRPAGG
jgi:serine/threonine-protein kinase/endoribonuclease IRE1